MGWEHPDATQSKPLKIFQPKKIIRSSVPQDTSKGCKLSINKDYAGWLTSVPQDTSDNSGSVPQDTSDALEPSSKKDSPDALDSVPQDTSGPGSVPQDTSSSVLQDTSGSVPQDTHKRKGKKERKKSADSEKSAVSDELLDVARKFMRHRERELGPKLVKVTEKAVVDGAKTLDKLIRIDGFDLEQDILPALRWGVQDEFWDDTKFQNLFAAYKGSKRGDRKKYRADGSEGVVD